jgi:tetratricopeptide (TPR) repeat protein
MSHARTARTQPVARLFEAAVRLQQRGMLREAGERHEQVLRQAPDHLGSLQLLGVIEAQQGRAERALALLRKAVKRHPSASDAHNNLGMVLQSMNRGTEAVAHYEKAIAINLHYAVAHNNMGIALAGLERHDEAIASYRRALAIQPDYAEAHSNLASELMAMGRPAEALPALERALTLRPDLADARLNLGTALTLLQRHAAAADEYRKLVADRPRWTKARLALGGALLAAGRAAEAVPQLERAVEQEPNEAAGHHCLGSALLELGTIAAGRQHLRCAVALSPRHVPFLRALVTAETIASDDPVLATLQQLASQAATLPQAEQIDVHFALGKALGDAGQPDAAFRHQLAGNALIRRSIVYHEANILGRMERTANVFDPALLERLSGQGDPDETPVFIVGMPRSGSTLVEQILAAHPGVFAAGEVSALRAAARSVGLEKAATRFPETMREADGEQLRTLASHYLAALRRAAAAAATPPARITDKMPANFRYAGLIHLALPQARIIHTRRDPIDTCLSCFAVQFDQPFAHDLGELGRHWRAYDRLMAHWRAVLPPGVMLEVPYEEVVADFETWARRIVAHCGLAWDNACLAFHEVRRPVHTASMVQVRQPIYRSSVGRWRPDAETLRPLLDGLHPGRDGE